MNKYYYYQCKFSDDTTYATIFSSGLELDVVWDSIYICNKDIHNISEDEPITIILPDCSIFYCTRAGNRNLFSKNFHRILNEF